MNTGLQLIEHQFDVAPLEGLPVEWSPNKSYIRCTKDATNAEIREAIQRISSFRGAAENALSFAHLTLGRFVLDYIAQTKQDASVEEAIDELELEKLTGKSWKTIAKWVRVVQILTEDEINPALSISTLYAAARQKVPDTPVKRAEWLEARTDILKQAAEEPDDRGARWVEVKLSEVQDRLKIAPIKRNLTGTEILRKACALYWLQTLEDSDLEVHNLNRRAIGDQLILAELLLRERGLLPEPGDELYLPTF